MLPPTVKNGHKNNTPSKCATTDSYSIHERFLKRYNNKEVCTSALLAPFLFSYATITSLNNLIIHFSFRICFADLFSLVYRSQTQLSTHFFLSYIPFVLSPPISRTNVQCFPGGSKVSFATIWMRLMFCRNSLPPDDEFLQNTDKQT